jgi:hypothetical protein
MRDPSVAQVAKDLKPVYAAASEAEALNQFAEFSGKWEKLSGYYTAVGERVARICAIPAVRPGNKDRDLYHQQRLNLSMPGSGGP